MRFSRVLILLLVGLALLQAAHYAPLLPERVATHFDEAGQANGWSSKTEFLVLNLAMSAGMALLFLGISLLMARIPPALINLPNKDYWLADERRATTMDYIRRQMEWLGAATLALLLGINQLTIQTNLDSAGAMPGGAFWLLFGSFMVFFAVWMASFLRKLYVKVPRGDDML